MKNYEERSIEYSEQHSADKLQQTCLQQGFINGYREAYNKAIDDVFLKIIKKEINGIEMTYPPESLILSFNKMKI